jgi:hypothetical protein
MAKLWCGSGLIRRFLTNFGAGSCGPPLVFAETLTKWVAVMALTRYIRRYGRGVGSCYKGEAKNAVEVPDSLIAVVQRCSPSLCGLPQQGSWLLVLRILCSR